MAGIRARRESALWLSLAAAKMPESRELERKEAPRAESALKWAGNVATCGALCSDGG